MSVKVEVTAMDGQWGMGTVFGGPSGDQGVYPITSRFGPREAIVTANGNTGGFHQGLDIGYPEGVPLVAMVDVDVQYVVQNHPIYGNYLICTPAGVGVDDEDYLQIWYGHMSDITVTEGQRAHEGEIVGHVGSTGMASGPHLHLEVRNRNGVTDPFNFLMALGKPSAPVLTPATRAEVIALLQGGAQYVDMRPATQAVAIFL